MNNRRHTVGVRIPDNRIVRFLAESLGHPIVTTSIRDEDEIIEYTTDPNYIFEKYEHQVDLVIHAGYGKNIPSTVFDVSNGDFVLVRQGLGDPEIA